ncbi:MAG: amidohydrolase, partial [Saprospiraceae bacterium]|nr:amidohydrolase [Saprospiraceae bacterium]
MKDSDILFLIKEKSTAYLNEIISIRRHFHMYPELSFEEKETSSYICQKLNSMGISYKSEIGGYGIVATIRGKSNDSVVALRADMDALPIFETNEITYKSQTDGIMHACGHDVHMSSLLGATRILQDIREYLPFTIRIIFQPGEEKLPGGASLMIREKVLEGPRPECIVGQHVFPSLPSGKVGIRSGLYMASSDEIYIEVVGKGGHAAMPHECTDTILAASQILVSLQQIVARNGDPSIPTVLSFGRFNSDGGATNIMPDKVYLAGTFRTMNEKWRSDAHKLILKISDETAKAYGVECQVKIVIGYPCLYN